MSRWLRRDAPVLATQLALLAALVAVWAVAAQRRWINPIILPRPDAVVVAFGKLVTQGATWEHVRLTLAEILAAFAISVVAGLALGIWASRTEHRASVVEPLLVAMYTVPIVLIYPIMILFFGLGSGSKIAFAGLYGFFPIAASTLRGLRSVDSRFIVSAMSMGASRAHLNRYVLVPAAFPLVMSGIRIGASLDLIGVLAGEILSSTDGLGHEIASATGLLETANLYAYIVLTVILIGILNVFISRAEERPL